MATLLAAIAVLLFSGAAALAVQSRPVWCSACAVGGVVAAAVLGIVAAVDVLVGGSLQSLHLAWNVPYGTFYVELDALSAFFLLPIFTVSAAAAMWGSEYLLAHRGHGSLGAAWFFFNTLVASMVLVVIARNGVLFLFAWEAMALASFFLVTFDDDDEHVRAAGWTYLVATHLGTAFLLVFFVLLAGHADSFDFDRFAAPPPQAGLLFVLALIGFGTKAGLIPFHVWLPEAHPAAPSHVSAVMSGVMIKTGIYGLIRMLSFLGPPPAWWGWLLIAAGLCSGIYGVLFALAQHDLKRLLAYSSMENIGIVVLALGVGLIGLNASLPTLATLGFAGALLHVLNHAIFKCLLFLGAGDVLYATGSRSIDLLGGLLKRLPSTGVAFFIGAVAIAGLPPLNGFVGEWLIYLAVFDGVRSTNQSVAATAVVVIGGLALIGGLAAACFTNAFGTVFLGEPRSRVAAQGHAAGVAMRLPVVLLAAACVAIGYLAPLVVGALMPVVRDATGLSPGDVNVALDLASSSLWSILVAASALLAIVAALVCLRRLLLGRRVVEAAPTWDCGYAAPTPRMQYTGASFAQPLTELFALLLQTRRRYSPAAGLFPSDASFDTQTGDLCSERLYEPTFVRIAAALRSARWLQHGRVHVYVLYIALTLLVLLVWKLG